MAQQWRYNALQNTIIMIKNECEFPQHTINIKSDSVIFKTCLEQVYLDAIYCNTQEVDLSLKTSI